MQIAHLQMTFKNDVRNDERFPDRFPIDMSYTQTELEKANQRVVESERYVAQQRALVAKFKAAGDPTHVAERLLADFEQTLRHRIFQRDVIKRAIGRSST